MSNIRPSDVFLKADIVALLRALGLSAQSNEGNFEYTRGYLAALATVATALSIPPADVIDITRIGGWDA